MTLLSYPPLNIEPQPESTPEKMTIATTNPGGRPRGSKGNGKTLVEIANREERMIARAQAEMEIKNARSQADQMMRISDLKAKAHTLKIDNYVSQERARAPQFQIDTRPILFILLALAAVTFITTAALSADGTIGAATAAKYAFPWFGYLLFGALEIATLAFMLMYYILGSRLDYEGNRIRSVQWFVAMVAAAVVAVSLSVYHVLAAYNFDLTNGAVWVGVGIRLVTTLFFVVVAKGIATVLFAKAIQL